MEPVQRSFHFKMSAEVDMEMRVLLALQTNDDVQLNSFYNALYKKVESYPKIKKGELAGRIGMSLRDMPILPACSPCLNRNVGAEIFLPHDVQKDQNFVALQ